MAMRARVAGLTAVLVLTLTEIFSAISWGIARADPAGTFTREALHELRRCRTPLDVRKLPRDSERRLTFLQFPDGSWIAARMHLSDHSQNSWNAAAMLDSRGRLYRTDHHFCVGLEAELDAMGPVPSLQAFHDSYGAYFKLVPVQ